MASDMEKKSEGNGMRKINLSELYVSMQKEMLHKLATGTTAIIHPGTKGDNTESNWLSWFQEYLPNRYKVAKGIVIDSTGRESEQIDLIIYDAQYSYLVFHQENTLLIPAESVYAVFEIKQELNKEVIEYAGEKAKSVRELVRTSAPIIHAGGKNPPKALHEILAGVLTTRCVWKEPIANMTVKYIKELEREEHLDFVCSVSDNTFVIENNIFINEYDATSAPKIHYCREQESLMYLLLNLLRRLSYIGTVPAIDYNKYAEKISDYLYR